MSSRLLALALAAAAAIAACTGAPPSSSSASASVELTVFAAASLGNVLAELESAYESTHAGATLTVSTDSSAALATQIEQGAPADVFLAADTTNPQKLVDGGLADGGAVVFAGNELTIITPADNPGGLREPFDLAKEGVRVVAAGDEVPITRYATQLVANLAAAPDAPAELAEAYAANVVSKEDNVSAVRAKVELGEADAAIVYATDAAASDEVAAIAVPDSVNVPVSYAGMVVKASENRDAAQAFVDWLAGSEGQAILAELGFLPPPP